MGRIEPAGIWWNYKTEQHEALNTPPTDYSAYIPQSVAAQGVYECHIKLGKSPAEAAICVLSVIVGEETC